jgi:drug/metabolite transporter (DMT)-like permease
MQLDLLGVSLIVGCCVIWGLQQVAAKAVLSSLPPLFQGGVRSGSAALMLWAWSAWRGVPLFERDGTLLAGLLAGVLFGAEFAVIYLALPLTSASRLIVFLYMAPFVVALGLPLLVRAERLDKTQSIGLVCAFAALSYAFAEGFHAPRHDQLLGDALGVLGALLWGLTTLTVRASRLASTSAEKTLFYQLALSSPMLLAFSWLRGESWPSSNLPELAWMSLLFQTAVVAFASFLTWFWLLRHYLATRISSFTFLTPLFGLLFGSWLLDEVVGVRLPIALLFVGIGIYLVNRSRKAIIEP